MSYLSAGTHWWRVDAETRPAQHERLCLNSGSIDAVNPIRNTYLQKELVLEYRECLRRTNSFCRYVFRMG
jgi:hypothetical protein